MIAESMLMQLEQVFAQHHLTPAGSALGQAVHELRSLKHELEDPNYAFNGQRVHRQSIVVKDKIIETLKEVIAEAKAKVDRLVLTNPHIGLQDIFK